MTYRAKIFLAALGAATVALAVAAVLVSWSFRQQIETRIERTLVSQTRLAAAALEGRIGAIDVDRAADDLGRLTGARVTVVAADGRVIGDSELEGGELAAVESHARRPEIVAAGSQEIGLARRYSTTVGADMLYAARRLSAATGERGSGWIRLALPLTEVDEQLGAAGRIVWPAFAAAVAVALVGAWGISRQLTRRLEAIADAAKRHAGDLALPVPAQGTDEVASVARMVNQSAGALRSQIAVVAADRARMAAILSGMVEGVLVVDQRGRVQLANEAAHAMLGIGDEEAGAGRHHLEIIRHPDVTAHLSRALAGETTAGTEIVLQRHPDRTYIARAAPVSAAPAAGVDTGGAVLVLHDITSLRRADRIRRDFVANVSHELRTPLTAIRGYVEALLDDQEEPADRRRFLEIVDRHVTRMERLVKDLLRLARLDAGQELSEPAPVRADALLDAVEAELASSIGHKSIAIERRIAPEAETIRADPARLHDVLRNLLENAVNYSPEGGAITVSAARHGTQVVLQIEDEGPGIPPADVERVFERFYRVDKGRAQDPGGTGLGLAIVKHLVGLHGGTIGAESRPGRGALFTVTLPQGSGAEG